MRDRCPPATIVVPPPATVTEGPSNKKRKKDMKDDVNSLLMASIKRDLIATESAESNDKDPDTFFCLSLLQDFKELCKTTEFYRVTNVQK